MLILIENINMKSINHVVTFTIVFFSALLSVASYAQKGHPYTNKEYLILTPAPKPQPRLNGPLVYGGRPGHPFLYRIPCQGDRPIQFSITRLPKELKLDKETGIISGIIPSKGEYELVIQAANSSGKDKRNFKIIAGEKLALTPPMGWNHWYTHYNRITDKIMREAADIMISSGMADVGYQYVNIDQGWQNALKSDDLKRVGPSRDEKGNILSNYYFPDMEGLTDYIHTKGLKAGIYTSPGPTTCGAFPGSYLHEEQDALQFAAWGFDFLKYDLCSYRKFLENDKSLAALQKPYLQMGNILKSLDRDIIYNLCQYGFGDVWKWGAEVGGNSWRTAGDFGLHLDHLFDVALKNAEHWEYSKPGGWNDPDYILIGWVGNARKETLPELTTMPPNMQYAYMSLWSLMATPLIYSGDMSKLDEFTLNILCNPEVIEVNQDPLGIGGRVIKNTDSSFLMIKDLVDGSKAVGLFNRSMEPTNVSVDWESLQIKGQQTVRDLWRQEEIGKYRRQFSIVVPSQGVVMVKISGKSM